MTSTLNSRTLAAMLAGAALAVTAASAEAMPDYGSAGPRGDVSSSSPKVEQAPAAGQDLRSPDARDAESGYRPDVEQTPVAGQDLRSPDARDAGSGYRPEPVAIAATETVSSSDGFDWASAAIGVAAVGGAAILLLGLVGFRRRHTPGAHPA